MAQDQLPKITQVAENTKKTPTSNILMRGVKGLGNMVGIREKPVVIKVPAILAIENEINYKAASRMKQEILMAASALGLNLTAVKGEIGFHSTKPLTTDELETLERLSSVCVGRARTEDWGSKSALNSSPNMAQNMPLTKSTPEVVNTKPTPAPAVETPVIAENTKPPTSNIVVRGLKGFGNKINFRPDKEVAKPTPEVVNTKPAPAPVVENPIIVENMQLDSGPNFIHVPSITDLQATCGYDTSSMLKKHILDEANKQGLNLTAVRGETGFRSEHPLTKEELEKLSQITSEKVETVGNVSKESLKAFMKERDQKRPPLPTNPNIQRWAKAVTSERTI